MTETAIDICEKCTCDSETKTIDCEELKLNKMFREIDWIALNNTKTIPDIVK